MKHINFAKDLGVKESEMIVLSPYIQTGEERDYKKDPIVIKKMDDEMIEITFWE